MRSSSILEISTLLQTYAIIPFSLNVPIKVPVVSPTVIHKFKILPVKKQ